MEERPALSRDPEEVGSVDAQTDRRPRAAWEEDGWALTCHYLFAPFARSSSLPPGSHGKSTDWVDASHLRRTRLDLSLGVPFVLVFALPVVGYLAPLFAVFAPRYIPSTFHTSVHVGTFLKEDARAGRQVLKCLLELYGFHGQACALGKMRELIRRIERGHGQIDTLTDLIDLADIMHELTPNIGVLPRAHLRQLHQSLTHSSFIAQRLYTSRMLARDLERWRDTIWEDDQLLERHGIERLTTAQVVEALYARGIYRHPLAMAFVLQQTQHRALQSVDAKTHQDDLAKPDLLQPPSPSRPTEAVRVHWRKTLREWVQLHRMVHEGVERRRASAADPSLTAPIDTGASEAAATESSVPTKEQVRPGVASSVVSPDSSFPMAFIVHVPALARVPQTITPTDKPAPMPPPPTGETPAQIDVKELNAAAASSTAA